MSATSPAPLPHPGKIRWGPPALVAGLTLACFARAIPHDFVNWDDPDTIQLNAHIRNFSEANLRWMFATYSMGHYHPLTWVSLAVDHAVWGLAPQGYHLTNVLFHALNALLVYFLILAFLGDRPAPAFPAVVGALFFALHPLRVESVAWATERRDVLSSCFLLLSVLFYLRHARETPSSLRFLVLSWAAFALSLLSKAWGMTLPVVLLVLDVWPLRRFSGRTLAEKIPYAILACVAGTVAAMAQRESGAMIGEAHTPMGRAAQAAYGLCFYVVKTVAPVGLSPLYLLKSEPSFARPVFLLAALGVAAITTLAILLRRRWPWALVAWIVYAVVVSPVLGIAQSGPQIAADRYSYLACLPGAVLAAAVVDRLLRREGAARAVGLGSGTALLGLAALTLLQIGVWRDSISLWTQAIDLDSGQYFAHNNRGLARMAAGDARGALEDFSEAVRIKPEFSEGWQNRALVRQRLGDLPGAIGDFSESIRLKPGDPLRHAARGRARQLSGDVSGAEADYLRSLALAPPIWELRAQVELWLSEVRRR